MEAEKFYNRTEAVEEIKRRSRFIVSYITLWAWEKKGYIKPTGIMGDGKRQVPVFTSPDIDEIINTIKAYKREGKIKVRRIPKKEL